MSSSAWTLSSAVRRSDRARCAIGLVKEADQPEDDQDASGNTEQPQDERTPHRRHLLLSRIADVSYSQTPCRRRTRWPAGAPMRDGSAGPPIFRGLSHDRVSVRGIGELPRIVILTTCGVRVSPSRRTGDSIWNDHRLDGETSRLGSVSAAPGAPFRAADRARWEGPAALAIAAATPTRPTPVPLLARRKRAVQPPRTCRSGWASATLPPTSCHCRLDTRDP
jgi:hypothetical protein